MRSATALVLGLLLSLGTTVAQAAVADGAGTLPLPLDGTGTSPGHAAGPGTSPSLATGPGTYIVTLSDRPAAAYNGGVTGFAATRPAAGHRYDRTRPAVTAYTRRLIHRQDQVLAGIGSPTVLYRFTTALDGFAAVLSGQQVKQLRDSPGVALVERSTKQTVDAVHSPDFLGLEGPGGVWAEHGGPERAGRGTVIGVIDTGIWPENPSFAGLPQATPGISGRLPHFHGACAPGQEWAPNDCNDKVVSARYFVKGFGRDNLARSEYLSPRDGSGHGSHTASTAAGNHGVTVTIQGQDFGRSSGMAPAARIAAYKACWAAPDPNDDGCDTADTVAAIDRAVADGVDVLNYSISGSQDTADAVELAFLNAATAGVFVAASAGNGGPEAGSVAHPSPWVTTVGASTHQLFQGSVVLGNGASYVGAMISDRPVAETGIVLAEDAASPGAAEADARLCRIGALDAAKAQGKIVVCDRGVTARVDKSTAVARAGGAGMVLANTEPSSTDADFHDVPTVHVDVTAAEEIKSYVTEKGDQATASLDPDGSKVTPIPQVAGFSARGPSPVAGEDFLKPDLTAPGVDVVGAVAPASDSGRLWDVYSGTSMSTAHIAGLAALVRGVDPTWAPARIKSAMMTTAYDLDGTTGPFAEGAGHVDPKHLLDPGLVFDSGPGGWRAYLAGRKDAAEVNLPSIAVGELTGHRTVTRRVTNVSSKSESYSARVTGLDGLNVSVRPSTMTLTPGQTRRFRIRVTARDQASADHYAKGWLTWTGLTHQVRSPVVVKPVEVSAPAELTGSGDSGSVAARGTAGPGEPVDLSSTGLVPASPTGISLVPGGFDPTAPESDPDTFATTVGVPAATEVARFQMESHNQGDDVDLYVYRGHDLVGSAASVSSDETVTLVEPPAGKYTVYVNASSAANGATTTGQLFTWVVGQRGGTPLTLSQDTVDAGPGEPFRYSATWSGLDMTQRWFGAVRYGDSGARTLVSVG
jgi:hypothetical protein